jgi:hypothetical protein
MVATLDMQVMVDIVVTVVDTGAVAVVADAVVVVVDVAVVAVNAPLIIQHDFTTKKGDRKTYFDALYNFICVIILIRQLKSETDFIARKIVLFQAFSTFE